MTTDKNTMLGVRLPDSLIREIDAIAKRRTKDAHEIITRAEVVRELVTAGVEALRSGKRAA